MKTALAGLAAVLIAAGAAQASSIVGDWAGIGTTVPPSWTEVGALVFSSATASGPNLALLGTINVTCIGSPDPSCGTDGILPISGTLFATGVLDFGTAANPNGFVGSYLGGDTFTGVVTSRNGDVFDWTFTRTAVPEPATLALLGIGIAAMGLHRRRSAARA